MPEVTDPNLLAMLNGGPAPAQPAVPGFIPGTPKAVDPYKDAGDKRDQTRTDIAVRGEVRDVDNTAFNQKDKLSERYSKLPEVKNYRVAVQQLAQAINTGEGPQSDLALTYAFAKAMDPESVVRESEQGMVTGSQPWFTSAVEATKKQFGMDGAGNYTPETRKQIRTQIANSVAQRNKLYNQQRNYFTELAKRNQFDPYEIVGEHDANPFAESVRAWGREDTVGQDDPAMAGNVPAAGDDDASLKAKFPDAARFLRANGEIVGYEDANGEFVAVVDSGPQASGGGLDQALYAGVGDVAEGVGDTLGLVANPLNAGINYVAGTNFSTDLGQTFRDATGAPQGNEMASAINKAGTSALTFTGGANALQPVTQGATKLVTNALASQPVQQFVGALTGGASAEVARQSGAPVPLQVAAGIAGGGVGFSGTNALLRSGQAAPNATQAAGTASQRLIPNAQQVVQDGKASGVRVMTTDIRPPSTRTGKLARTMGESIPLTGTAGPRAAQQIERGNAVQSLMKEFGADELAIEAVSKDLVKTRGARIEKLKGAKDSVIDNIPGAVPAPKAIAEIDKQIANLKGIDDTAFNPVIDRLNGFKTALQSGKNLKQVEGQRRLLGDLFSDTSLASIKGDGQKAINAIYDPLRQDMGAFIEAAAGPSAKAKWAGANDQLSAMAGELDASAFKNLLNNAETTPESAAKIIFGKTPSDMKRLNGSLSDKGRTKVQSAIMFQAAEKSTTNDIISPQKFATAMEAMSKATGVFFSPADKARIDGVTRLIKATQQASDAAANPMTGAQNTPLIAGLSIGQIFGTAALPVTAAAGLLARVYESGPVRDAFLRLGRTKPGSPQERAMIPQVMTAIAAANDNPSIVEYMRGAPGLSQAAASEDVNKERPIQP